MSNIEIFYQSKPSIGYIARTITPGLEFEMVQKYITYLEKKYSKLSKKKIAIFIEPQIETGYPDIIIVEYFDCINNRWNEHRKDLSLNDIKILFQIQHSKNITIESLEYYLGFSEKEIKKSITKLSKCNLIHVSSFKKSVSNVQLYSYCHINKLISIEAKIDKWTEVINQAITNIWFATESYILMNKGTCSDEMINKCRKHGIGIILINGGIHTILKSQKRSFPVSYASLLFNEWIQKHNKNLG